MRNRKSHSTKDHKLCDTRPYGDLLVVALLGTPAPPPAGLPPLRRLLLAATLGLPAALAPLPLRVGLPAGSATTTSLRCHGACSTPVLLRREAAKQENEPINFNGICGNGSTCAFIAPTAQKLDI